MKRIILGLVLISISSFAMATGPIVIKKSGVVVLEVREKHDDFASFTLNYGGNDITFKEIINEKKLGHWSSKQISELIDIVDTARFEQGVDEDLQSGLEKLAMKLRL